MNFGTGFCSYVLTANIEVLAYKMIWSWKINLELCSHFGLLMQAIIVSCCGCFHGRTLGAISMSCDNDATRGFGPLVPGQLKVDFGDAIALEKAFKGL